MGKCDVNKVAVCMAILAIVWGGGMSKAEGGVTCGQVVTNLSPCVAYVRSDGKEATVPCCNGIRTLFNVAHTPTDRQQVCKCIKQAVNGIHYSNHSFTLAAQLPKKCGISIPYQITPSIDCARVH